jgi:regulation of enolase protein 1 (concanavalin A-like superfamily)
MIRQTYLSDAPALEVGVMVCAPTGKGFAVHFEDFAIAGINT